MAERKKKILIFAHYYVPDKASTGQILKDQAEGMLKQFDVTVICVVPSYDGKVDEKYKTQKYYFEELNGVKVIRVRVPEFTKVNKISRIKNIAAYFFGALGASRRTGKQDYIFTISQPPILGGLLGVLGKWEKQGKMIYCIQDFNPEQVMAVGYFRNKMTLKFAMFLDKFSCRHSDLIITVGRDLIQTIESRFAGKKVPKYTMINNWIDEKKVYPLNPDNEKVVKFKKDHGLEKKFVIMYSGNIGLYYDLEKLIKVLKRFRKGYTQNGIYEKGPKTLDGREVFFAFIGTGSVLKNLKDYVLRHRFENIVFIPYQDKEDLIYSLNAGDVHWCVNAKGIKGVSCPSKAYGIMGVGKPIIGVLEEGSEIRMLIEEIGCGRCCEPGDYDEVADIISWYIENAGSDIVRNMGMEGRKYLEKNLTKDINIQKYIAEIAAL
ncbi:MAG: glycosyltransferase family 4 protein [Hungatella sp.]|jgi:glycosyltransferase involved in cell wall biosynthesis|nr:glycosyltransferase family 4 protein [Hungatella sp.]MCI9635188.1 glycosyltransferase family 4 protein [Hungatella sp.]